MKKLIALTCLFLLIISSFSYAKTEKVFDSCGQLQSYKKQRWYNSMVKKLEKSGYSTSIYKKEEEGKNKISEICFSKTLGIVVLNVPLKNTDKTYFETSTTLIEKKDGVTEYIPTFKKKFYAFPHTILKYSISTNELKQAQKKFDIIERTSKGEERNYDVNKKYYFGRNLSNNSYEAVYFGDILFEFGKRNGDYIEMQTEGYGDAGCYSFSTYRYYYMSNVLMWDKKCSSCETDGGSSKLECINHIK